MLRWCVLKDVLVFRHKMKRSTAGKILLFVLAFVAMLAFAVPVAFAQELVPEAPLEAVFTNVAKVLPIAILMGLLTSLLSYLKQTPPEKFELEKFLATAMISVIMVS